MRKISCGVIITDGERLLLGHATRSPRWDIPKGLVEPEETLADAACRELHEETGLVVQPDALVPLGTRRYLPGKDLALFLWHPERLPDPASLSCASVFTAPDGTAVPEFDRFALVSWDAALSRVGKNMARLLGELHPRPAS
jgi:8-oxo-dGTP pyrophosphatase MutT (NUDIX family)